VQFSATYLLSSHCRSICYCSWSRSNCSSVYNCIDAKFNALIICKFLLYFGKCYKSIIFTSNSYPRAYSYSTLHAWWFYTELGLVVCLLLGYIPGSFSSVGYWRRQCCIAEYVFKCIPKLIIKYIAKFVTKYIVGHYQVWLQYRIHVEYISSPCWVHIKYMLSAYQVHVEYISSTCWAHIKYMLSAHQVHVEYKSSTCWARYWVWSRSVTQFSKVATYLLFILLADVLLSHLSL